MKRSPFWDNILYIPVVLVFVCAIHFINHVPDSQIGRPDFWWQSVGYVAAMWACCWATKLRADEVWEKRMKERAE